METRLFRRCGAISGTIFKFACAAGLVFVSFPALAGVKEGVEKWQAGDYKAAVVEWLPYAAKGDPDALFNLGQAYKLGRGVPLDKVKAEDFYRRAADKGHAPAQSNLGIVLAQRGEKAAAAELWQKAAEKKDARAQYMLGVLHFNGDTLPKNWPLAYAYMLQANNAGLPQAARALSTMNVNIPQPERDRGTDLAKSMAGGKFAASGKQVVSDRTVTESGNSKLQTADIPAKSKSASSAPPKPPAPKPVSVTAVQPPKPQAKPVVTQASVPEATKAAASTVWRVQLGAYAKEARAREAWTLFRSEQSTIAGVNEPFYVAAGDIVRLQIGSFNSAASAGKLCQQLKDAGRTCFVVHAN